MLAGKEIDIFLPELNKGVEYNGEYWHNNEETSRKIELAKKYNIELLIIWEKNWKNKRELCEKEILSFLSFDSKN